MVINSGDILNILTVNFFEFVNLKETRIDKLKRKINGNGKPAIEQE